MATQQQQAASSQFMTQQQQQPQQQQQAHQQHQHPQHQHQAAPNSAGPHQFNMPPPPPPHHAHPLSHPHGNQSGITGGPTSTNQYDPYNQQQQQQFRPPPPPSQSATNNADPVNSYDYYQQQAQQQQQQQPASYFPQYYAVPQPPSQQQQQQQQQAANATPLQVLPKPAPLVEKLSQILPQPPLSLAQIRPESLVQSAPKRARRRSKYTKEQDEMIVELKKAGKSWVAIADITGVGSFLAARNRYQVLIGQQGGGTSECDADDIMALHGLIDEGEVEKWRYIAKEFQKITGKNFSDKELKDIIKYFFWTNPESFGITDAYLKQYLDNKTVKPKKNKNNKDSRKRKTPSQSQAAIQAALPPQQQLPQQPQQYYNLQSY